MIRINLIPREEQISGKNAGPNWTNISIVIAPIVFLLALASLSMYQSHQIMVLEMMINDEESAMAHYGPAIEKIRTLRQEKGDVQNRLDAIESLDRNRRLAVRILETINRSVPRYLWIDNLDETGLEGGTVVIEGNTFSNLSVSDFIDRLEESELFETVDLTITKEERIGTNKVVQFSILAAGVRGVEVEPGESTVASLYVTVEGG